MLEEKWTKPMNGYVIKATSNNGIELVSAYTYSGDYIGDVALARKLCEQMGIRPEKANPRDSVCTIGFSDKDHKWYAWSHRGIAGFGIGDTVRNGDLLNKSGAFPIGYKAASSEGAKRMAIEFARAIQ